MLSALAEVFGVCMFTLVIATGECNASKMVIYMNGIYFFPAVWQVMKRISKCCGNEDDNENTPFCSTLRKLLRILAPPLSFLLACGGLGFDLYSHYKKVRFYWYTIVSKLLVYFRALCN